MRFFQGKISLTGYWLSVLTIKAKKGTLLTLMWWLAQSLPTLYYLHPMDLLMPQPTPWDSFTASLSSVSSSLPLVFLLWIFQVPSPKPSSCQVLPFSSIPLKLSSLMISSTRSVFLLLLHRLTSLLPQAPCFPWAPLLYPQSSFTDVHTILSFLSQECTPYWLNISLLSFQAVSHEVSLFSLSCFSKSLKWWMSDPLHFPYSGQSWLCFPRVNVFLCGSWTFLCFSPCLNH